MPSITLSDLQEAVDNAYGDFTIDLGEKVATFTAILRLPKDKRDKLAALTDNQVRTADDFMNFVKEFFRLRAKMPADFKALEAALGDSPANWTELFEVAAKVENPGEA